MFTQVERDLASCTACSGPCPALRVPERRGWSRRLRRGPSKTSLSRKRRGAGGEEDRRPACRERPRGVPESGMAPPRRFAERHGGRPYDCQIAEGRPSPSNPQAGLETPTRPTATAVRQGLIDALRRRGESYPETLALEERFLFKVQRRIVRLPPGHGGLRGIEGRDRVARMLCGPASGGNGCAGGGDSAVMSSFQFLLDDVSSLLRHAPSLAASASTRAFRPEEFASLPRGGVRTIPVVGRGC